MYRYEEQLRQREMLYQQQQQRLYQEVRDEKERVAETGRRQRAEVDALQRKLEDTHANLMASVRNEYEASKAEQDKRHEVCRLNASHSPSCGPLSFDKNKAKYLADFANWHLVNTNEELGGLATVIPLFAKLLWLLLSVQAKIRQLKEQLAIQTVEI